MAIPKFNVPNLCGASPELNAALSKIDDLKKEITANIDIDPSAMASALTSKLNDVKSSLDGLAPDLPEIPAINFQSELTSLISDIDKTSIEGLAAFNNKLADIEKNFGDALTKAGKSLDSLVADATTAIAGGGDVCKIAPNFELPQTAEAEVIEKAAGVKTALKNAVDEAPSIVKNNVNVDSVKEKLKAKKESIKNGTAFTTTTKKTNIVTSSGNTIKASTSKDRVTKSETGEKERATKSEDGIAGKFKIIKDAFYNDANITTHPFEEVQLKVLDGRGKPFLVENFKKNKYKAVTNLEDQLLTHEPIEIVSFYTMMWYLSPQSLNVGRKVWFIGYLIVKADGTIKTNIETLKPRVEAGAQLDVTKQYDVDPNNPKRILNPAMAGDTNFIAWNLKYKILNKVDTSYR